VIEIRDVGHLAVATNPVPVTEAVLDIERSLEQSTHSDRLAAVVWRSAGKERGRGA
jgi:hypothetical protein